MHATAQAGKLSVFESSFHHFDILNTSSTNGSTNQTDRQEKLFPHRTADHEPTPPTLPQLDGGYGKPRLSRVTLLGWCYKEGRGRKYPGIS